MQDKMIKNISVRVIVILALVVAAALVAVRILNLRTAELEKEISEEMSADIVRPVLDEDEASDGYPSSESKEDETEDGLRESTEAIEEKSSAEETEDATEEWTAQESAETLLESESDDGDASEESAQIPTGTQAPTATPEPTKAPTATPEPTKTPTAAPEPTKAPTATPGPTKAPTATPEPTKAPTATPTPSPTPTPTPTPAPVVGNPTPLSYTEDRTYVTEAQAQLFKNRLLQNINDLRAANGLGALTMDACLSSGASVRANEISSSWSHTRPNGERGLYVLEGCGGYYADAISCIRNGLPHSYSLGENLAVSYSWSNYTGTDQEILDLADEVFSNWRGSPDHLENLLYPAYTKIGLGLYVNMDEDIYHAFWVCGLFSNK